MSAMTLRLMTLAALPLAMGCGGGSPSSPSAAAPPPVLTNPATPTTQSGCSATYTCPDAAGVPTFDRVTLSTGTSPSCRAPLLRNQPLSSNLQVELTIRNPQAGWLWSNGGGSQPNPMGGTPPNGSAASPGPFQYTAAFGDVGAPIATGLEFTTVLRLFTFPSNNPASLGLRCEITVYGTVPRS